MLQLAPLQSALAPGTWSRGPSATSPQISRAVSCGSAPVGQGPCHFGFGWGSAPRGATPAGLLAAGLVAAAAALLGGARRPRGRGARGRGRAHVVVARRAKEHYQLAKIRPTIGRVDDIGRAFFLSQCPVEDPSKPEIAVFGQSNVGKSSFINYLCNRKLLATVSKKPGHTRLIQHFLVDRAWYLVDLPGIGKAQGTVSKLEAMDRMVQAYVRHRSTLIELLYLVDASVKPSPMDLHGIKWLTDANVFLSIVLTKTDIARKHSRVPAVDELSRALLKMEGSPWRLGLKKELPPMFLTSSQLKTGKEHVLHHIAELRSRVRARTPRAEKELKERAKFRKNEDGVYTEVQRTGPPGIR